MSTTTVIWRDQHDPFVYHLGTQGNLLSGKTCIYHCATLSADEIGDAVEDIDVHELDKVTTEPRPITLRIEF